jgi:hypothetical protein
LVLVSRAKSAAMLLLEPLSCSTNVPAADVLKLRDKLVTLSSRGGKRHRERPPACRRCRMQSRWRWRASGGSRKQESIGRTNKGGRQGAVSCRRGCALGGSQRQTQQQRTARQSGVFRSGAQRTPPMPEQFPIPDNKMTTDTLIGTGWNLLYLRAPQARFSTSPAVTPDVLLPLLSDCCREQSGGVYRRPLQTCMCGKCANKQIDMST